tara:strand:+ start:21186 stop:23096 length:1911 start_codon:yes stop_codon:yes gene_type:complete
MNGEITFSLLELEYLVYEEKKESKIKALEIIDKTLVNLSAPYWDITKTIRLNLNPSEDQSFTYNFVNEGKLFFTRLTNAIGLLILSLNENENEMLSYLDRFLNKKNTLDNIFSNSIYSNSDHLLKLLLKEKNNTLTTAIDKMKFKLLYSLESELPTAAIESILTFTKEDYFYYSLLLISSSVVATENSVKNKNFLLQNLPKFIDSLAEGDITKLDARYLSSVYFNCTYSSINDKHKIKGSIHSFLKKLKLVTLDQKENYINNQLGFSKSKSKNCILIIHETFTSPHALYRCYGQILKSLKEDYYLIGITQYQDNIDTDTKKVFDKHFVFDISECLLKIKEIVNKYHPIATYFPSIGMHPLTIFASSYKFTKKYIMSTGHPAPTYNPNIDYVLHYKNANIKKDLEEHVIYKKLNKMIPQGLPGIKPKITDDWVILKESKDHKELNKVKIAITSSAYKLNISILNMIKLLQENYKDRLEFNIFVAGSSGTIYFKTARIFDQATNGKLRIYPHTSYEKYIFNLSKCHLFLSPFPFGMSNSLMDCVSQGLLGPCLSGETIVQDCEEKMFESLGLSKFICKSEKEYFALMQKLINCFLKKEGNILEEVRCLPKPQSSIENMSKWSLDDYQDFKEIFKSCIN